MKLTNNQPAPAFQTVDVYGKPISLEQLRGKKVLLTFFRTGGCPVCNLRFHQLEAEWAFFKANNLVFVAVYASKPETMLQYIRSSYPNQTPYPIFVANPDQSLYKRFGTERSLGKLIRSLLFHGGFSNVNQGKKLFRETIVDDGPVDLINADFLIDEQGKIVTAYYGHHSGDFIPVETIRDFATKH
jgi:peroxiredoxin